MNNFFQIYSTFSASTAAAAQASAATAAATSAPTLTGGRDIEIVLIEQNVIKNMSKDTK